MHVYVSTCRGHRTTSAAIFLGTVYLGFLKQALSLTWNSACRIDWLATAPRNLPVSAFPPLLALLLNMGAGDQT